MRLPTELLHTKRKRLRRLNLSGKNSLSLTHPSPISPTSTPEFRHRADQSFFEAPKFQRAEVPRMPVYDPSLSSTQFPVQPAVPHDTNASVAPRMAQCVACQQIHPLGSCPLKVAGVEYCNLCGLAHYGFARLCPHINSETQVRAMLDAVRHSSEAGLMKKEALKYLTGVKGTLVQKKKREAEKAAEKAAVARSLMFDTDAQQQQVQQAQQRYQGQPAPHANGGSQQQSAPRASNGTDPVYMQRWALGGLAR